MPWNFGTKLFRKLVHLTKVVACCLVAMVLFGMLVSTNCTLLRQRRRIKTKALRSSLKNLQEMDLKTIKICQNATKLSPILVGKVFYKIKWQLFLKRFGKWDHHWRNPGPLYALWQSKCSFSIFATIPLKFYGFLKKRS